MTMDDINREAQRAMNKDVEENHALYAALAGGCSCDKCEGEDWYTGDNDD